MTPSSRIAKDWIAREMETRTRPRIPKKKRKSEEDIERDNKERDNKNV